MGSFEPPAFIPRVFVTNGPTMGFAAAQATGDQHALSPVRPVGLLMRMHSFVHCSGHEEMDLVH